MDSYSPVTIFVRSAKSFVYQYSEGRKIGLILLSDLGPGDKEKFVG